ncbi:M17 family peptidase N-terminal domain-containing protein [Mucilaginibacter xinganensis]|uniref:Peptidase M17 n=1 Tax=Mucilaginibacter xinganensis TaxID=1234841 RepID=A0A223NS12_9SPHI|nr:M17 family peptidase N-terminal domain-containing protein [Mucilaginibacter xinganensis]ASU32560.1 peptidase M17 [Mucilaginibacter xinganensis]
MKTQKSPFFRFTQRSFIVAVVLSIFISTAQAQDKAHIEPVGTHKIFGKLHGISIEGMVQSPSAEVTPLQFICVFEYQEGDIFNAPALPAAANGLYHIDKQLNGLFTDLRKSGKFSGHALETLLINPQRGIIGAKRLMLIGLGDRSKFTPDIMIEVGKLEIREALRLGVTSYAHASDLKDGGLDSPTALIINNVLKGTMDGYETELYLESKKAAQLKPVLKITLLAGQQFFDVSGIAITQFIQNYHQ